MFHRLRVKKFDYHLHLCEAQQQPKLKIKKKETKKLNFTIQIVLKNALVKFGQILLIVINEH